MRKAAPVPQTRLKEQSPDLFEISMSKGRAKHHMKNKTTVTEEKPDLFELRIMNPGRKLHYDWKSPSNAENVYKPGKKMVKPSPVP